MADEKTKIGQLTIEARLLDVGLPAPKPGDMYIISLMRYEAMKVVRGKYPHQFILVGHSTPDLQSPQFQIGAVHRLQLSREFPKHSTILNKFENESRDAEFFFCLSFEVMA